MLLFMAWWFHLQHWDLDGLGTPETCCTMNGAGHKTNQVLSLQVSKPKFCLELVHACAINFTNPS